MSQDRVAFTIPFSGQLRTVDDVPVAVAAWLYEYLLSQAGYLRRRAIRVRNPAAWLSTAARERITASDKGGEEWARISADTERKLAVCAKFSTAAPDMPASSLLRHLWRSCTDDEQGRAVLKGLAVVTGHSFKAGSTCAVCFAGQSGEWQGVVEQLRELKVWLLRELYVELVAAGATTPCDASCPCDPSHEEWF